MRVIYPITVTPDVLVSSSIPDETTYPAFAAGTTYNTGDRVILDQQAVYECLAAGVVGALPLSDAEWVIVRPTNRWSMFDQLPSTSRQQSDTLTITLAVPAVGDVMLLGVVAASVTVALPDVTRTVTLASGAEQSVYITGLGSAGGNLTITIQPVLTEISVGVSSLILSVAEILVGTVIDLGETQLGAGVGISDYSTRTIDEYGNASFVRRGYSGFLQAQFILDRDDADLVLDTITALRAVPCVWIGSLHYQCAVIYGYYREAGMEIRENHAQCSMRIESLAVDTLNGTVSGGGGGGGGGGGWWGDWNGWEQPVQPTPSNVVLLVRGESAPLVDASALNRSISADSGVVSSFSPQLFGSTTAIRCIVFADPAAITATASSSVVAAGDFCAESFIYIMGNYPTNRLIQFGFGPLSLQVLRDQEALRLYFNGVLSASITGVVPIDQWTHLAWSRKDGVISAYISGVRVLQYGNTSDIDLTTVTLGRGLGNAEGSPVYMKYARITNGISVYDGASFPPLTSGY
ncbi:MAG: hypothetical protein RJA63_80 [Pseudomonadota bacterium]|jgi:hypothetical protein